MSKPSASQPTAAGGVAAAWPIVALVVAALYFCLDVLWGRGLRHESVASFDLYTSFVPNLAYALGSLREGHGLLWNPYQNCGQPFFADSLTGLLYPTNVLFLLLDRELAIVTAVFINLLIGGVGTFALCREMRLSTTAAVCGALAFQLGGTCSTLAAWTVANLAVYVWLPVAMWRTERLLGHATFANAVWLAIVLAVQSLPGSPQVLFFTYQVILLRLIWALASRTLERPVPTLGLLGIGCALPILLAAVQLLPSIEHAAQSVRAASLADSDIGFSFTWDTLRTSLGGPRISGHPGVVTMVTLALAAVALGRSRPSSLAIFYVALALVYALLSLGPNGLLYPVYAKLPFGSTFRMPVRFLWVVNFAAAVLCACGVDALLARTAGAARPARLGIAVLSASTGLFFIIAGRWPAPEEWWVIGGTCVFAAAALWRARRAALSALVVLLVAVNLGAASRSVVSGLRSGGIYGPDRDAFEFIRPRMTPQDRVAVVGALGDLMLMPKAASLFRVASIYDYAPQASRSYAEFYTWMRIHRRITTLNEWYYPLSGVLPKGFNEHLLNLTAARFVVVSSKVEEPGRGRRWRELDRTDRWTIFENPDALARARFVPRLIEAPAEQVLPLLAQSGGSRREAAFVSQPVPSTTDANPRGVVEITVDEPEHLEAQVNATGPGYLYLADQHAPGWEASVNGTTAEILRANHAFRAVAVPAGRSTVSFRYRPRSLLVGAALTLLTLAALLVATRLTRAPSRQ